MQDYLRGSADSPCAALARDHEKVWIVSVTSHEHEALVRDGDDRLALVFDDIEPHTDRSTGIELGRDPQYTYFDQAMAEKTCAFIRRAHEDHPTRRDLLLVNCHAGVSRSGAIADFTRAVVEIDHEDFRRLNPQILPNSLVRRLLFRAWDGLGLEPAD
jgi:predicted protein tyrosine phosphatase